MDLNEQSEMNPNQPFRAETQSQFQSQYPYPPSSSTFAIDQDMSMGADSFAVTVQAHAAASLDDGAAGASAGRSTASIDASAPAISSPGMAPPQSAAHPYSPGGRPSIDDTQDGGLSGGDPRRKRSKVSRACDECRRKKVRCDAAADDGTIKTCSNCARAGLTCEYSRIPMKRGPSKGYIKELSERVQHVESVQMALSNGPGYRQSLDATGGVYAEPPYSPDDPMSARRNFSFSAESRSPFVGPDYNRERIPSVGGWNSGSPHSAIFRARDRGSIAVAPDQQPISSVSFTKPFWAQEMEGSPPAKRQKLDSNKAPNPELGQEFLNTYYREYHNYLPILPNADTVIAVVEKASTKVQNAFVTAIQRLPSSRMKTKNGNDFKEVVSTKIPTSFKTLGELAGFMWDAARESPHLRSAEDNLLYIWTFLMMGIEAERDLTRLHDGPLARTALIKQAVDLGWSCVTAASIEAGNSSGPEPEGASYVKEFARAWHCATVPARLHALAVGSSNPIPTFHQQHIEKRVPTVDEVLETPGIVVTLTAAQLTVVSRLVQNNLPPGPYGRNVEILHRTTIQDQFDSLIANRAFTKGNELLLEQLKLFLDLTLSRFGPNFHPLDITISAAALAEALRKDIAASDASFQYNPFNLHICTLTTISLLEFMSEGPDTEMFRIANSGIEDMKATLEQISERDHIEDEEQEDNAFQSFDNASKPIHWSDALLKMIDVRVKKVATLHANGIDTSCPPASRNLGDGTNATLDFSMLLRHGYLTVLFQQLGQ